MRPQCPQDSPDGPVVRPVELLFGILGLFDDDGEDDGADFVLVLVPWLSDGASDGLDDVDFGVSGIHERDAIEVWDVDAFGEHACVGEDDLIGF